MKAIETIYDRYKFRSRLEARYAVFFNTLALEYEYEKEGYDLDGLSYLPDFYLPELHCWVEIKAGLPSKLEREKAIRLCLSTMQHVFLFAGPPGEKVGLGFAPFTSPFSVSPAFMRAILLQDSGTRWISSDEFLTVFGGGDFDRKFLWSEHVSWMACDSCTNVGLQALGGLRPHERPCFSTCIGCTLESKRLEAAYNAAKQARFEYGEKP